MFYHILLFGFDLFVISNTAVSETDKNIVTNDVADALLSILCTDEENNTKINELKDKLKKINSYVVDKDTYAQILTNTTKETDLNETNFYEALKEEDHFKFLTENEPKNLYLKLKEKMNRDDILKILADRGEDSYVVKSARKMIGENHSGKLDDNDINIVIDKLIAEMPNDDHKYDFKRNDSMYWDPQGELEDLKQYHQHDGRRLFKGERTTVRYYPFMVSIHVMERFWCGGSIYWHDLVLTSASCLQLMHNNRFYRENPKNLAVRIGSNHSRIGGEVVDALEISQKLAYEPIFLQRKFLPIYPNTFCKEVYGDKFKTSTMFCAGTLTTGEGACDHDAGGPAILGGKLVGIISFGPTICGYPNATTVFTLVGAYADWIETINETISGYYRRNKQTTTSTRKPLFDYFATLVFGITANILQPDPLAVRHITPL